jgi:hypothetical protein
MPAAPSTADPAGSSSGVLSRRQAVLICATAGLVVLMGAGLCSAAILVPAPAAVVPLVAVSCAGLPILAGWRVPVAVDCLRTRPRCLTELSVAALRRDLDRLPETEHPLGE